MQHAYVALFLAFCLSASTHASPEQWAARIPLISHQPGVVAFASQAAILNAIHAGENDFVVAGSSNTIVQPTLNALARSMQFETRVSIVVCIDCLNLPSNRAYLYKHFERDLTCLMAPQSARQRPLLSAIPKSAQSSIVLKSEQDLLAGFAMGNAIPTTQQGNAREQEKNQITTNSLVLLRWLNRETGRLRTIDGNLEAIATTSSELAANLHTVRLTTTTTATTTTTTTITNEKKDSSGTTCDQVLASEMSPHRFRDEFLLRARPVVVKGALHKWPALSTWNAEYIDKIAGKRAVRVKVVPRSTAASNAASQGVFEGSESAADWGGTDGVPDYILKRLASAKRVLVRPASVTMPLSSLLKYILGSNINSTCEEQDAELGEGVGIAFSDSGPSNNAEGDRCAEQDTSENMRDASTCGSDTLDGSHNIKHEHPASNMSMYVEYLNLEAHLPELAKDIGNVAFAQLLDESLSGFESSEAEVFRNVWIGDGHTVGKLHFDPFDNLLAVVKGAKTFQVYDPDQGSFLYEGHLRETAYKVDMDTGSFKRVMLETTSMVNSPVDITRPNMTAFPLFANATSINCRAEAGDVLFLPAFWWHEVRSEPDETTRLNLAVNFWYPPVFTRRFPCPECRRRFNVNVYDDLLRRREE